MSTFQRRAMRRRSLSASACSNPRPAARDSVGSVARAVAPRGTRASFVASPQNAPSNGPLPCRRAASCLLLAICFGTSHLGHRSEPVLSPHGSVVVVTGASSGLGLASAVRLAEQGYTVWAGMRAAHLDRCIPELELPNVDRIPLDVTNEADVAALQVRLQNVTLAALVSNAGVAHKIGHAAYDEDTQRLFDVNVFGAMRVFSACLPALVRSGGRLVLITSFLGVVPLPGLATYTATKAALEGWAAAARMENIVPVSTVVDGFIRTGLTDTDGHYHNPGWPYKRSVGPGGLQQTWMDAFVTQLDEHTGAVGRAIADRYPRHRYVVGWDATLTMGACWLFPRWLTHLFINGLYDHFG